MRAPLLSYPSIHLSIMTRNSLEKPSDDLVESFPEEKVSDDHVDKHLQIEVPESLRGLSAEEIAVIDKAATRKLDILLMPILVILYIL